MSAKFKAVLKWHENTLKAWQTQESYELDSREEAEVELVDLAINYASDNTFYMHDEAFEDYKADSDENEDLSWYTGPGIYDGGAGNDKQWEPGQAVFADGDFTIEIVEC